MMRNQGFDIVVIAAKEEEEYGGGHKEMTYKETDDSWYGGCWWNMVLAQAQGMVADIEWDQQDQGPLSTPCLG